MSETPKKMLNKNDSDSMLLAGLCYVPFMMINLVAICYVLLANKGGKYAKFHALQSLSAWMVLLVVFGAVYLVYLPIMMSNMAQFITSAKAGNDTSEAVVGMITAMLPLYALGFLMILAFIGMAIAVALGKDVKLPVIGKFVSRFV